MNNYFFIDGSALLQQIKYLQQQRAEFDGKRLSIFYFVHNFLSLAGSALRGEGCRRIVFYFVKGEERLKNHIALPDLSIPSPGGFVPDIAIKECGTPLKNLSKKQKDFLASITDDDIRELCTKKEKGVDIQICCDALKLATTGRMDRLFLLTNDSDFLPLCETLKDFGTNVSLIHLSQVNQLNKDLRQACDMYLVLRDNELHHAFSPSPYDQAPS